MFYPAKILFRIKGHVVSFPVKKKLKEFIVTKPFIWNVKGTHSLKKKKMIKTMKNKMTTDTYYLSTIDSKNKETIEF